MADQLLNLKDVTRDFRDANKTVHALKKTNFTISAGEFVAIIGPSGSGKSTFLTIAGGLQNPSSGKVTIDGTDITNLSRKELSAVRLHKVGFILQASNLVPFLTLENQLIFIDRVMRRKTDKEAIESIFTSLDIGKLRDKYPSDLSGGERQRAAIAKVLYGRSSLILADEPTASLDTKKAFEVVELLAEETHRRKKATIMVTHDERLLKYCDAVYEMRDGELKPRKNP
jgi:putative ABC transport system ATP-binding protein